MGQIYKSFENFSNFFLQNYYLLKKIVTFVMLKNSCLPRCPCCRVKYFFVPLRLSKKAKHRYGNFKKYYKI